MIDEGLEERERRHAQSYRNLVTIVVFGVIIGTLAVLYYAAAGGAAGGIAGAVCTVGFLAIAFLGWEYLMKPGYGLQARVRARRSEIEEGPPPEEPRSPGAP